MTLLASAHRGRGGGDRKGNGDGVVARCIFAARVHRRGHPAPRGPKGVAFWARGGVPQLAEAWVCRDAPARRVGRREPLGQRSRSSAERAAVARFRTEVRGTPQNVGERRLIRLVPAERERESATKNLGLESSCWSRGDMATRAVAAPSRAPWSLVTTNRVSVSALRPAAGSGYLRLPPSRLRAPPPQSPRLCPAEPGVIEESRHATLTADSGVWRPFRGTLCAGG